MLPIVLAQNAEARNVTPRFASLPDALQLSLALRLAERKLPEAFAEAAPLIRALDGEGLLRFGEALLFMASAEDCLR